MFLRKIDRETPKNKELHLICDNYAMHKHPKVRQWLHQHHPLADRMRTPTASRSNV